MMTPQSLAHLMTLVTAQTPRIGYVVKGEKKAESREKEC
jgi:hypothetical protein